MESYLSCIGYKIETFLHFVRVLALRSSTTPTVHLDLDRSLFRQGGLLGFTDVVWLDREVNE